MNSTAKLVVFWLIIVLSGLLLWRVVKGANSSANRNITFSEFLSEVDQGNVSEVTIIGQEVRGRFKNDKKSFHTTIMTGCTEMMNELREKDVNVTVKNTQPSGSRTWLLNLAPFVLLGVLWFLMIRTIRRRTTTSTPSQ